MTDWQKEAHAIIGNCMHCGSTRMPFIDDAEAFVRLYRDMEREHGPEFRLVKLYQNRCACDECINAFKERQRKEREAANAIKKQVRKEAIDFKKARKEEIRSHAQAELGGV